MLAATTGIGSLPHTELGPALELSAVFDVPFLPQLPRRDPIEGMVAAALEGLPGFAVGADGSCVVDVDRWRRQRDGFGLSIHAALRTGELALFEPSSSTCSSLQPFLAQLTARKTPVAKVQLAGPGTVRWAARLATDEPLSELAELDEQVFRLVLARSLALVHAVKRAGAAPIFFVDEPGLVALLPANPRHRLVLDELKVLIAALKAAGAKVGLHCCSNTAWSELLALGLDFLSFDARLSLDAVLEDRAASERFFAGGGSFALGVVPTAPGDRYLLAELVDAIDVSLRSTAPRGADLGVRMGRMLLTPACGLATHAVADAERISSELFEAQRLFRIASGSEVELGEDRPRR